MRLLRLYTCGLAFAALLCLWGGCVKSPDNALPASVPANGCQTPLPEGRTIPASAADLTRKGEDIIARYACRSCHRPDTNTELAGAPELAPPLSRIAERRTGEWLRRYLHAPYPVRKNQLERMPNLALSDYDVELLARYLELLGTERLKLLPEFSLARETDPRRPRLLLGRSLFIRYNCMNCHSLGKHQIRIQRDAEGNVVFQHGALRAPDLTHAWQRLRPAWLLAVIQHPSDWMPWSRMPELNVTEEDAQDLAWYILNAIPSPPTDVTAARVAELLGDKCASCHGGNSPDAGLNLTSLDGLRRGAIDDLGNRREAVVPFAENSPLLGRMNGQKAHPQFPADAALTDDELAELTNWVLAGAPGYRE
ncbi:MAG: cytochrome c [Planctomycetes bacterium]|nr:cytochrome c [Planctomycetota bacterium]